jgi:glycosyltransferase involved in cell wall biosynthesis
MGPDPRVGGGMSVAIRGLLESELARTFRLDFVATYEGPAAFRRLTIFCRALLMLVVWGVRGSGRIVHIHATVRGSAVRKSICVLVAKGTGRKVVVHVHSGAGDIATFRASCGRGRLALLRAALRAADRVLVVSAASGVALQDAGHKGDFAVVPNPAPTVIDLDPAARRSAPVELVFLGGFANVVKGGEVIVAALPALLELAPGLRITLAGPGVPPASLRALAEANPDVTWVGWLDATDKDALMRRASIFAMPSLSEGMPMALLEAMAYELAIVATHAGGIPELIESGRDGLLIEPDEPKALTDAIQLLWGDPDLRRRLGQAAGDSARGFGGDRVAAEVAAIYRVLA